MKETLRFVNRFLWVGGLLAKNRDFKDLLSKKYPFKTFMGKYTVSSNNRIEITFQYFNYGLAYIICGEFYNIVHVNAIRYQYVDVINSGFSHTEGNPGTINVWRDNYGTLYIENKKSNEISVEVRLFSIDISDR